MCRQVCVLAGHSDTAHQSGASLITEGHDVVVQTIGQTVEVSNRETFGPQLYEAAFRLHNDHVKQEVLNVGLRVSEPGSQEMETLLIARASTCSNVKEILKGFFSCTSR